MDLHLLANALPRSRSRVTPRVPDEFMDARCLHHRFGDADLVDVGETLPPRSKRSRRKCARRKAVTCSLCSPQHAMWSSRADAGPGTPARGQGRRNKNSRAMGPGSGSSWLKSPHFIGICGRSGARHRLSPGRRCARRPSPARRTNGTVATRDWASRHPGTRPPHPVTFAGNGEEQVIPVPDDGRRSLVEGDEVPSPDCRLVGFSAKPKAWI